MPVAVEASYNQGSALGQKCARYLSKSNAYKEHQKILTKVQQAGTASTLKMREQLIQKTTALEHLLEAKLLEQFEENMHYNDGEKKYRVALPYSAQLKSEIEHIEKSEYDIKTQLSQDYLLLTEEASNSQAILYLTAEGTPTLVIGGNLSKIPSDCTPIKLSYTFSAKSDQSLILSACENHSLPDGIRYEGDTPTPTPTPTPTATATATRTATPAPASASDTDGSGSRCDSSDNQSETSTRAPSPAWISKGHKSVNDSKMISTEKRSEKSDEAQDDTIATQKP